MSKAEKFISEHTRKLTQYGDDYFLWVTPDDARKAAEIAKEDAIEKTLDFLKDRLLVSLIFHIVFLFPISLSLL